MSRPVPMVDLLAVEPLASPKPEQVLDWSAPSIPFPLTTQQPSIFKQPVSQPSIFQPPVSQPSIFQPPVSQAPISQPPIFQPPVFQPPVPQPAQSYPDQSRESNIRNIMSMYGQVPQSQAPPQQPAFVPLGALAAEQMFKGRPGYPNSQQWPSF